MNTVGRSEIKMRPNHWFRNRNVYDLDRGCYGVGMEFKREWEEGSWGWQVKIMLVR